MISSSGEYYHSSASTCIIGSKGATVQYVTSGAECASCMTDIGSAFQSNLDVPVVGISKDGRVIYGPVKEWDHITNEKTEYTPCDLDVCNGKIMDIGTEKVYTYHATTFHPYIPTCFGPGQSSVPSNLGQQSEHR